MNLRLCSIIIVISFFFSLSTILAQRLAEPLENGHFEAGYSHYWHYGEFNWSPGNDSNADRWSNATLYFRIGLYDIITASVEGMVWPVSSSNNYPGGSFLNYTFGFGLYSSSIKLSKLRKSAKYTTTTEL